MLCRAIFIIINLLLISSSANAAKIYQCGEGDSLVFQSSPCAEDFNHGNGVSAFDGWQYGMNIIAVKAEAKRRNLPMGSNNILFSTQYNETIVNRDPSARAYSYFSEIAGKKVRVTLHFTQQSQRLYKVQARFMIMQNTKEEKRYFYDSLVRSLTSKYGEFMEVTNYPNSGNTFSKWTLKDIVGTAKLWGWTSNNVISLTGNNSIESAYDVIYRFTPLVKLNAAETTKEIKVNTNNDFIVDSNKF